jgi:hypothetical protein
MDLKEVSVTFNESTKEITVTGKVFLSATAAALYDGATVASTIAADGRQLLLTSVIPLA